MALDMGQVTPTTSSANLVFVPPGINSVVITNTSGVTVYVGIGTVTTGNGFAIPNGGAPVPFSTAPSSTGAQLTVIGGTGSITGPVSWLISSAQ